MKIRFYKCEKCHGMRIPEGCPQCDKVKSPDRLDHQDSFHDLMRRVIRGYKNAVMASGITPSEVLIGPKEARVLETEMSLQDSAGRVRFLDCHEPGQSMIAASMEGSRLMGLTVRIMEGDGVRVGCSWEGEQTLGT